MHSDNDTDVFAEEYIFNALRKIHSVFMYDNISFKSTWLSS